MIGYKSSLLCAYASLWIPFGLALADTSTCPVPRYRAEVVRVIDGDTYVMRLALGLEVEVVTTVRLAVVDTPEMRGEQRPRGEAAKSFVEDWFAEHRVLYVQASKKGKYGRWIGTITCGHGKDLGTAIVTAGHVK